MQKPNNDSTGTILARIEERLTSIEDDLADLKKRLIGNGNPGLVLKVDRLERAQAALSRLFWVAVVAIAGAAAGALFKGII